MIRGVLFDMDGVLSDSEPFILQAAMMMFSESGLRVKPEDFKPFVGTGENSYIGGVAEKYNLKVDIEKAKARTYVIYQEIIKGKLKALPGASDFVSSCHKRGFRLAIATSADNIKMVASLTEIGIPLTAFDAAVSGSDVINKKPAPEIYLKAAAMLGLKPSECLVVEDALSGIHAAKAAGCKCLAVATSFHGDYLKDADWVCQSLDEVPEEALNW